MATATAATQHEALNIRSIPLAKLRESKTNPRRHFAGLDELTASVRQHGVLTPLLAREIAASLFEIVAGARRFRAAMKAGLEEVPVRILELTDEQALEFQVIENLQREDVHPLDEALGYDALLKSGSNDVAAIAAKVNKSESYVYQRLKLAALIPEAQKAFVEEKITAGHAILIARLQPGQQAEALEACFDWNDTTISVRGLGQWIEQNVHLDLKSAAFPKDDTELLPKAGSCVECPKRTGFAPALFPDVKKKDTCTDPECFHQKQAAFVELQVKKAEASGQEVTQLSGEYDDKDKSHVARTVWQEFEHKGAQCASAVKGIVVNGREQGKIIRYCTDKKCKTHGAQARQAASISSYSSSGRSPAERKKDRLRRENLELRKHVFRATVEAGTYRPRDEETRAIILRVADWLDHDHAKAVCEAMQWEAKVQYSSRDYRGELRKHLRAMKTGELERWLLWLVVADQGLFYDAYLGSIPKAKLLDQCAKRAKVKVREIAKRLAIQKAKKKPAAKAAAPRKGVCRVCGCTKSSACVGKEFAAGVCSWTDKTKTLCSNPKCVKAAKVQTSAKAA